MRSLIYLFLHILKNKIVDTVKKPVKLAMYLLLFAVLAYFFIIPFMTNNQADEIMALVLSEEDAAKNLFSELKLLLFVGIAIIAISFVIKGLKKGDAIFEMSDVNFIFVSPINPRTTLLYGAVRMMNTSFLLGFFVLFQSHTLAGIFGIKINDMLLIFGGFIIIIFLLQILSMIIYNLTNGRPKRKMYVRCALAAVFIPFLSGAVYQLMINNGSVPDALIALVNSPVTAWTPVAGWAAAGIIALISGEIISGIFFSGLLIISAVSLLLFLLLSNPDYFEDVLVATETAFEKKRELAEGNIDAVNNADKKIKIAKTGISGDGASVFFYKHLRETGRSSKFGLLDIYTLITVIIAIILSIVRRLNSSGENDIDITFVLFTLMSIKVMLIGSGRGLTELYSHYLYLIPEPSFKKLVFSNMEIVYKTFIESLLAFGISGIILGEKAYVIILAFIVYTVFGLFLIGINILSLRITTSVINAGLLIIYYLIAVVIIMLPGIILAYIAGGAAGLIILAVWEMIAALGCFALSKGLLHKCDMPTMKVM